MMRWLRSLSVAGEAGLILLLCFGAWLLAAVLSLVALIKGLRVAPPWIDDRSGMILALGQIGALLAVAGIARVRGWRLGEMGFHVTWKLVGIGCGLALGVTAVFQGLGFDRVFAFGVRSEQSRW